MFAAESRGELPKGTARRWAHETKDIKKLPERKHKKEAALMGGFIDEIVKIAKERRSPGENEGNSGLVGVAIRVSNRVGKKHGDRAIIRKVQEIMRNVREPSSD